MSNPKIQIRASHRYWSRDATPNRETDFRSELILYASLSHSDIYGFRAPQWLLAEVA